MPATTPTPLLSVRDLTIRLNTPEQTFLAVDGVSFDLGAGESLALVGESGSGKTMTAMALLGLLPNQAHMESGEIQLRGRPVSGKGERRSRALRGKEIAIIFQDAAAALNPVFRIGTQFSDVIVTHWQCSRKAAKRRALAVLDSVGFSEAEGILRAYPHQLSGGMAQRVMIALALSCRPQVVIADEPTAALDVTTQAQVLDLMSRLQDEQGFALLLISHDMGVVSAVADRVLVMQRGRIVEQGTLAELSAHPLHPLTRALIDAIPDLASAA